MRKPIPEVQYRSSRVCRVLGNPTAYEIVRLLAVRRMRPSEIAQHFGLSLPTVSGVLRSLRQLDLVRYITLKDGKEYFIKEPTIVSVMQRIERLIRRLKTREY